MVNTEEKLGPVVEWGTISADGTTAEMNLSKMKPEVKILVARGLLESRLGENAMSPLDDLGIQMSESDADLVLEALSADRVHINVPNRPAAQTPKSR